MRTVKLGFVAAALLLGTTALTTPAFATSNQDHTCQGGHNCNTGGGGDVDIDIDNKNTAYGGQGGTAYGGKGGNADANADATAVNFNANIAKGGDAYAKGGNADADAHAYNKNDIDLHNKNDIDIDNRIKNDINNKNVNKNDVDVRNSNKNDVDVRNTNKNDIDNRNYNKNYSKNDNDNTNTNNNTNKQHQKQQQQQQQNQNQSQSSYNENDNSNSNNASLEVNTYNERAPVNTAYAAPLATGEDTCMGSSSIGAQAVSFGLSLGTTWQDDNCRRLKNSRQLVALGYHRAATALMCVDEDVRQAMVEAGTPCPSASQTAMVVVPAVAPTVQRDYVPMAPVANPPKKKVRKVRKPLPPK